MSEQRRPKGWEEADFTEALVERWKHWKPLTWTTEAPTEAGQYWVEDGREQFIAFWTPLMPGSFQYGNSDIPLKHCGRWAGPIPLPVQPPEQADAE